VIRMRPENAPAIRQLTKTGTIQVFQGPNASGYVGDRKYFDSDAPLTIQLHHTQVVERESKMILGDYLVTGWRIPEQSQYGWLVEVDA
jgi:hypothetical protein